jgi:DNA-binding PadR family transcriptional regulator
MTPRDPAAGLSSVFGAPAAALKRRRRRPVREEPPVETRPAPRPTRTGTVEVRDRRHVDLLLLAAAAHGPATGYQLIDRIRDRSDGLVELPVRVVVPELRRLTRNRLVEATDDRVRRYALTPLGRRILAARQEDWARFCLALGRVLDASDRERG